MKVEVKNDLDSGPVFVEIHCTDITDDVNKLERYIKRYKAAIPATADGERVNLATEAILYIESVDKRTFIYTENRVLMTEKRLYELEEVLDKRDFFRCSKSTIIHLN